MMDSKAYALVFSYDELRILDEFGGSHLLEDFSSQVMEHGVILYTISEDKKNKLWMEASLAFEAHDAKIDESAGF